MSCQWNKFNYSHTPLVYYVCFYLFSCLGTSICLFRQLQRCRDVDTKKHYTSLRTLVKELFARVGTLFILCISLFPKERIYALLLYLEACLCYNQSMKSQRNNTIDSTFLKWYFKVLFHWNILWVLINYGLIEKIIVLLYFMS